MNCQKSLFAKGAFFTLVLFTVFSIFTCNPGLGNQVDTKAPTIEIVSPVTKSTLSGDFTITGKAKDDLAVASVSVVFTSIVNGKDGQSYGPYPASLSGETWTVSVTSRDGATVTNLPDGDYKIKATATDRGGHTGETDVVYTIDTTPPTVRVNQPLTYEIPPEIAKTIVIKGEIFDKSFIDSVEVHIVNGQGDVLAKTQMTGGNSFIATFDSPDELLPYDNYSSILYYYVVATDAGGNKNTYFYHKDNLEQSYSSMTALGKIDQSADTNEILDAYKLPLANKENASALLAAGAYPDFKYSSVEQNKIQWLNIGSVTQTPQNGVSEIGVGISVFGTVLPTSSESSLSTAEAWVFSIDQATADTIKGNGSAQIVEENGVDKLKMADGSKKIIEDNANKISSTMETEHATENQAFFKIQGSSYNFEIKSKKPGDDQDWGSGFWWVRVKGVTKDGDVLTDDAIFAVASEMPRVNETAFGGNAGTYFRGYMNAATIAAGKNKIAGYASRSDGNTVIPKLEIIKDGDKDNPANVFLAVNDYEYMIDFATDGSEDGEQTYLITAYDGNKSTTVQRIVVVDTTAPSITFTRPSANPTILNVPEYEIGGNAIDKNGISQINYKFWSGDNEPANWTQCSTGSSSFLITKNDVAALGALAESTQYKCKIQAIDNAGNSSESTLEFTVDISAPLAQILSPVAGTSGYILSGGANGRTITFSGIASDSVTTRGKKAKIARLSYTNDTGVKTVVEENMIDTSAMSNSPDGDGHYRWEKAITFPADGRYTVTLYVEDDATLNEEPGKSTEVSVKVNIDTCPPTIVLKEVKPISDSSADGSINWVNGNITVAFTIQDETQLSSNPAEIAYSIDAGQHWTNYTSNTSIEIDTYDWPDATLLGSVFRVKAADAVGNWADFNSCKAELDAYQINYASDKPVFATSSIEEVADASKAGVQFDAEGNQFDVNIFKKGAEVKLDVSDDDGLGSVFVSVDGGEYTPIVENISASRIVKSRQVKYNLNLEYGRHTLRFKVTDSEYEAATKPVVKQNKVVESVVYYVVIDDEDPSLNITSKSGSDNYVSSSFTITGTAKDASNGVAKIEFISQNNAGQTVTFYTQEFDTSDPANKDVSWTQTYDLTTQNKKPAPITIKVTDGIGRTKTDEYVYVYDNTPPLTPKFVDAARCNVPDNEVHDNFYDPTGGVGDADGYSPADFGTFNIPFAGMAIERYVANTGNTMTILGTTADPGDASTSSGIASVEWGLVKGKFMIEDGQHYGNKVGASLTEYATDILAKKYCYVYQQPSEFTVSYFWYKYDGEVSADGKTATGTIGQIYEILNDKPGHQDTCLYEWQTTNLEVSSNVREKNNIVTGEPQRAHVWRLEKSMPEFKSGECTIVFRAKDKVGNYSYPLIHYLIADNTQPSITVGMKADGVTPDGDDNSTIYVKPQSPADGEGYFDVAVTGTVTEANPLTWATFFQNDQVRAIGGDMMQYWPADTTYMASQAGIDAGLYGGQISGFVVDVTYEGGNVPDFDYTASCTGNVYIGYYAGDNYNPAALIANNDPATAALYPYLTPNPKDAISGSTTGLLPLIAPNLPSVSSQPYLPVFAIPGGLGNLLPEWKNTPWVWFGKLKAGANTVRFCVRDKAFYIPTAEKNSFIRTRTIVIDNTPPSFSYVDVSPQLTVNGKTVINGKVNLSALAQDPDDHLASVYYTTQLDKTYDRVNDDPSTVDLSDVAENKWIAFTTAQRSTGWSMSNVDTKDSANYYTDESGVQHLSYGFKAIDKAGNITYYQLNTVVDQNSDKPSISVIGGNLKSTLEGIDSPEKAGWDASGNAINVVYKQSPNITFVLSDDDGVKKAVVKVNDGEEQEINLSGAQQVNWNYSVEELSLGRHKLTFKITDTNDPGIESEEISYYIAVSGMKPSTTVNEWGEQTSRFVTRSMTLSGNAKAENGLDRVEITYPGNNGQSATETVNIANSVTSYDWTSNQITFGGSTGTINVYVVDKLGQKTGLANSLDYTIDEVPPTFAITYIDEMAYAADATYPVMAGNTGVASSTILGTISDNVGGSGVAKVSYMIDTNSTCAGWNPATGTIKDLSAQDSNFEYTISLTGFKGVCYAHIAGGDVAGNWSDPITLRMIVDAEVPTAVIIAPAANSVITSETEFRGTASDDIGLKSVTLQFAQWTVEDEGHEEDLHIGTYNFNNAPTTADWSLTLGKDTFKEGVRTIEFVVTDTANRSVTYSRVFKVDRTAPAIEFTNTAPVEGRTASFTSSNNAQNKVIINYSDAVSGVNTISYKFQRCDYGTDPAVESNWSDYVPEQAKIDAGAVAADTIEIGGVLSSTRDIPMASFLDGKVADGVTSTTDGLWRLVVTATDLASQTQTYVSDNFWVDQNTPMFTKENANHEFVSTISPIAPVQKLYNPFTVSGSVFDKQSGEIDEIEISITNVNYTTAEKAKFTRKFTIANGGLTEGENGYYDFIWSLDQGAETSPFLYNGLYTVSIVAQDKAGNEREVALTTSVDNDAPGMRFSRPYIMTVSSAGVQSSTTGNATDLMGTVSVVGQIPADQESGGMGSVYYQVGKWGEIALYDANGAQIVLNKNDANNDFGRDGKKIARVNFTGSNALGETYKVQDPVEGIIKGYWQDTGNTSNYNWNFDFNALNLVHGGHADPRVVAGKNDTLSESELQDPDKNTYWVTYAYVVAKDTAGNINLAILPINLDIDTDKPVVTILSPDPTAADQDRVFGGAFTIMGNATDDQKVDSVYMQIELVDGNYENNILTDRIKGTAFLGDEPQEAEMKDSEGNTVASYFADRTKWYKVKMGNKSSTTSWSLKINNKRVTQANDGSVTANDAGSLRIFDNRALKNYYTIGHTYNDDDQTRLIIRVKAYDTKEGSGIESPAVFGEPAVVTVFINAGAPSIDITVFPEPDAYVTGTVPYTFTISDDDVSVNYSAVIVGTGGRGGSLIDTTTVVRDGEGKTEATVSGTFDTAALATAYGNELSVTITATDAGSPPLTSYVTRRFFVDNNAPTIEKARKSDGTYDPTYYIIPSAIAGEELRTNDANKEMRISSTSATLNGYVNDGSGGSGIDYAIIWFTQTKNGVTKVYSVGGYDEGMDTTGSETYTVQAIDANGDTINVQLPVESWADINKNTGKIKYDANKNYVSGTRTPYIIIDAVEAGDDAGANGDLDGYNENISALGFWYFEFNSKKLADGHYDVNYAAVDKAGNIRYMKDKMFVMNNGPKVTGVNLSTDQTGSHSLDGQTVVQYVTTSKEDKEIDPNRDDFTMDYADPADNTIFKSMNYLLKLDIQATGTNGTLSYAIKNLTTTKTASNTTGVFQLDQAGGLLSASGTDRFEIVVTDELGLFSETMKLDVNMANTDSTAPKAQLLEFNTTPYEANTDWSGNFNGRPSGTWDKTIGHIEPRNTLTGGYATPNPTLSGKVWIRGEVLDDQKISGITLTLDGTEVPIATWSNGALVPVSTPTAGNRITAIELNSVQNQKGHFAEFAVLWDTSTSSGTVGTGKVINVVAYDGRGAETGSSSVVAYNSTTATRHTSANMYDMSSNWTYQQTNVDVRPYITKVSTALSKALSKTPSAFNRSAHGYYPVRQNETITIFGYNLGKYNSDTPAVKVNGGNAIKPTKVTENNVEYQVVTYKVPSNSCDLSLTVSSIEAVNNINDNTKEWNMEKNGQNNDTLTDDRRLKVWKFTTIVDDTAVRYPTMRVGKNSAQTIGFTYDSGAEYVKMYQGGNDFAIDKSFTQWYDTAVAIDEQGRMYGSAMNGDSGSKGNQSMVSGTNGGYGNYGFYAWNSNSYPGKTNVRDDYGTDSLKNAGSNGRQVYSSGTKKVCIESAFNSSKFNANRIMNPKIAVTSATTSNATAYVYTAYYDSSSEQLKFRYGTVDGTTNSNNQLTFGGGLKNHGNATGGSGGDVQIIAGSNAQGTNSIDEGDAVTNSARSGEYIAVGVSGSTALVAWYDQSKGRLLFSYNTAPTSTSNASQWGTHTKVIDSDMAGWYVDMAVDPEGHIHLAYYATGGGDLRYAYMDSYTSNPVVVTVDSYLSVGTNISIDVSSAKETVKTPTGTTTMYVPYISYYMSAFTKTAYSNRVAYLTNVSASGVPLNGVEIVDNTPNDMFTGNWEVMTIPTASTPLDYTVGVGIKDNGTGSGSTKVNKPILGYGTKAGLETAHLMDTQ